MGRTPKLTPSYLRHRCTGKARVVVRDQHGARREILLPGAYGSKESRAKYNRVGDGADSHYCEGLAAGLLQIQAAPVASLPLPRDATLLQAAANLKPAQ